MKSAADPLHTDFLASAIHELNFDLPRPVNRSISQLTVLLALLLLILALLLIPCHLALFPTSYDLNGDGFESRWVWAEPRAAVFVPRATAGCADGLSRGELGL